MAPNIFTCLIWVWIMSVLPSCYVAGRKSGDIPRFKINYPNMVIGETGTTVTLICPLENHRDVYINWEKDGSSVELFDNIRLVKNKKELRIFNISAEDKGVYSCIAANGNGQNVANIEVKVQDHLELTSNDQNSVDRFAAGSPYSTEKVVTGREPSFIYEARISFLKAFGSELKLDCRFRGSPKPNIVWMKDGVQIDSQKPQLLLRKLGANDAGNYSCTVMNIFGNISREFKVEVTIPKQECLHESPIIDEITPNVNVVLGMNLTLHCIVRHCRPVVLHWLPPRQDNPNQYEFSPISHYGENHRMEEERTSDGRYRKSLYIFGVTRGDLGTYGCVAADHRTSILSEEKVLVKINDDESAGTENTSAIPALPSSPISQFQVIVIVGCAFGVVVLLSFFVCLCYSIKKVARRSEAQQAYIGRVPPAIPTDYVIMHHDSPHGKSVPSESYSPIYGTYYEKKQQTISPFGSPPPASHSFHGSATLPVTHVFPNPRCTTYADSATEYEDVIDEMSTYEFHRHPPSMVSAYAYGGSSKTGK